MAKFCTNCGKEIVDGVAFCTECGAPASAETVKNVQAEPPRSTPPITPPSAPQPAFAPTPAYQAPPVPQPETNGVVGTGYFFGMMFLYSIPVLGWLICIITAFSGKNESKKHFARALLIWMIIGLIFSVVAFFALRVLGGVIMEYVNSDAGGQMSDLGRFLEQLQNSGLN